MYTDFGFTVKRSVLNKRNSFQLQNVIPTVLFPSFKPFYWCQNHCCRPIIVGVIARPMFYFSPVYLTYGKSYQKCLLTKTCWVFMSIIWCFIKFRDKSIFTNLVFLGVKSFVTFAMITSLLIIWNQNQNRFWELHAKFSNICYRHF